MSQAVYRFPVCERHGERENDFTVEVTARDERSAIVQAVAEGSGLTNLDYDRQAALRKTRNFLSGKLGKGWEAADFWDGQPDIWDGLDGFQSMFHFKRPTVNGRSDTAKAVMRRWVARQNDPGALADALLSVIDALGNDELERLFFSEIHRQREAEKGGA